MKSWIKTKRVRVGFIEQGFALCAVCSAGVALHKEFLPPAISCGDSHISGKNSLFTVQDLPDLCPREIKKQKIALYIQSEQKKKRRRLAARYK